MSVVRLIHSVALIPVFLLWTALMALLSLLVSLVDRTGRLQHGCARTWARLILRLSGAVIHAENVALENGPGPYIFVSNHQSFFDIFSLLALLPVQFRFFAKESLFRTPFIGWHLRRAGHLPIDRSNSRAAYQSFQAAIERIKAGDSVLVFPEGSRSRDGQIGSFRKGSLRLALTSGVPVVPIAIYGSRFLLPRGSILISPGHIYVSVGKAIVPSEVDLRQKDLFVESVRADIVERYKNLAVRSLKN